MDLIIGLSIFHMPTFIYREMFTEFFVYLYIGWQEL